MSSIPTFCSARVAGLLTAVAAVTFSVLSDGGCTFSDPSGDTSEDGSSPGDDASHEAGSGDAGRPGNGDAAIVPYDAGSAQPAIDTLCAAAMQLGKSVEEVIVVGGASSQPMGGTLQAGTYTLGNLYHYVTVPADAGNLDGSSGDAAVDGGDVGDDDDDDDDNTNEFAGDIVERKTLILASDGLFSLVAATGSPDAGLGPTVISAGVYTVAGDTVTFHGTCPAMSESTSTFYASGGVIELYQGDGLVEGFQQISSP